MSAFCEPLEAAPREDPPRQGQEDLLRGGEAELTELNRVDQEMPAGELSAARKEQIRQKYIQSRRRTTVLPLWYHAACILLVTGSSLAAAWLFWRLGLSGDLVGRINVQVFLGILATIVMAAITAYAVRKMFPQKYFGMLAYWLGAHIYLSVLVLVFVVLHSGFAFSRAPFNAVLMLSFYLVLGSGVVGFAIYKLGPKLLARIEGEGKLLEDITDRRRGLNLEVFELTHSGSDSFRRMVSDRVLPSVVTLAFLMRQYLKREPLAGLCAGMVESHAEEISRLPAEEQANMRRVIEDLVTARRLDAEYLLHRLLRIWLPAHVAFTAAMWLLIVVHVVIVMFF